MGSKGESKKSYAMPKVQVRTVVNDSQSTLLSEMKPIEANKSSYSDKVKATPKGAPLRPYRPKMTPSVVTPLSKREEKMKHSKLPPKYDNETSPEEKRSHVKHSKETSPQTPTLMMQHTHASKTPATSNVATIDSLKSNPPAASPDSSAPTSQEMPMLGSIVTPPDNISVKDTSSKDEAPSTIGSNNNTIFADALQAIADGKTNMLETPTYPDDGTRTDEDDAVFHAYIDDIDQEIRHAMKKAPVANSAKMFPSLEILLCNAIVDDDTFINFLHVQCIMEYEVLLMMFAHKEPFDVVRTLGYHCSVAHKTALAKLWSFSLFMAADPARQLVDVNTGAFSCHSYYYKWKQDWLLYWHRERYTATAHWFSAADHLRNAMTSCSNPSNSTHGSFQDGLPSLTLITNDVSQPSPSLSTEQAYVQALARHQQTKTVNRSRTPHTFTPAGWYISRPQYWRWGRIGSPSALHQ